MSPAVQRWRTKRHLDAMRAKFGEYHPATFAAYARAFVAWCGVIRPPAFDEQTLMDHIECNEPTCWDELRYLERELPSAYTRANLRALGCAGHYNRHERRARNVG